MAWHGIAWYGMAELEIVVELGNLVPRKNLVSQKDFEIFTELNSKKFLQNQILSGN